MKTNCSSSTSSRVAKCCSLAGSVFRTLIALEFDFFIYLHLFIYLYLFIYLFIWLIGCLFYFFDAVG